MKRTAIKRTALTLAILASFSYPAVSMAEAYLLIESPRTDTDLTYEGMVDIMGDGVWTGNDVTVTNAGAFAVRVINGGKFLGSAVTLANSIDSPNAGNVSTLLVAGESSGGTLTNADISLKTVASNSWVSPTQSAAVQLDDSATITLVNSSVSADGEGNTALLAMGGATITASDTAVTTKGNYGYGVRAYTSPNSNTNASINNVVTQLPDGGFALIPDSGFSAVDLTGGSITTNGDQSAVGAQAANYGSIVLLRNTDVTTSGRESMAVDVANGAVAVVDGGTITTSGDDAHGVNVYGRGYNYYDRDAGTGFVSAAVVRNVNIITAGSQAYGIAAGSSYSSGGGNVQVENSTITTLGNGSAAINASSGGIVVTNNVVATARGEEANAVQVGASRIYVRMAGSQSRAILEDPSALQASDSTFVSEQGAGIVLTNSAYAMLNNTEIRAAQESLVSILNIEGQNQQILISGDSKLTANNGTLLQVNRTEYGMDGNVTLTLGEGTVAAGNVIDTDGLVDGVRAAGGETTFLISDGATWTGQQQGLRDLTAGNGASVTDNGNAVIVGNVKGGENSKFTFMGDASIGGSFTLLNGSNANFNGSTSIGNEVNVVGSNLVFSGPASILGGFSADNTNVFFGGASGNSIGGGLTLTNSSVFKGGTQAAPIIIDGDVTMSTGAVLGGNIKASGQLNGKGGTNSPGNSIGTQEFGSIASLGSQYIAEINAAGQSDLIIANNGDVTLSDTALTVGQENGNGGYRINQDYTVLIAQNGTIVGNFASAGLDSSFDNTLVGLQPVKIGASDVKVRLGVDPVKVAALKQSLTPNQSHTLDGVVSVLGGNSIADALVTTAGVADSLNQLSGEIHASTQSALLYSSSQIRDALSDRMRSGNATQEATPLWAKVQGGDFSLKGDNNAAKAKTDTFGLTVGGDTAIAAGWRLGAAFGYTDGTTKVQDRASSKADVNSYTGALYGGKSWERQNGQIDFLAGAAFTHHDIKTRRNVTLGGNQTLKADYSGKAAQIFTEAGYGFNVAPNTKVGPYAGLAWTHLKSDSFDEKGGTAALSSGSRKDSVLTTTLGVRGQSTFDVKSAQATLHASLGWRHASGDVDPSRSMSFITGAGESFSIAGAPIAKDAAVLNLGISVDVTKRTTLGLGYNGQFGSHLSDNNGSLFMKVAF